MDEQLIKTLMEVYAERGVNLTEIIRDPMFHNLSLDSKIKMLKEHADEILNKSSDKITKREITPALKRAGLMASLAAGFGATGALKEFSTWGPMYKFPTQKVLGMGALAGGASLALSALAEMDALKQRKRTHNDFVAATTSPADNAYLKFLVKNQDSTIKPNVLTNPIKDKLNEFTNKANRLASEDAAIHGQYAAFKKTYAANPDVNFEDDPDLEEHFTKLVNQHKNQKTYKRF